MDLEHVASCRQVRQGDVDALVEAASDGVVESVGKVGGSQDQDSFVGGVGSGTDSLHLDEELGLDPPGCVFL